MSFYDDFYKNGDYSDRIEIPERDDYARNVAQQCLAQLRLNKQIAEEKAKEHTQKEKGDAPVSENSVNKANARTVSDRRFRDIMNESFPDLDERSQSEFIDPPSDKFGGAKPRSSLKDIFCSVTSGMPSLSSSMMSRSNEISKSDPVAGTLIADLVKKTRAVSENLAKSIKDGKIEGYNIESCDEGKSSSITFDDMKVAAREAMDEIRSII